MSASLSMDFQRRPSTVAYMVRGLHRGPGLREARCFPAIRAAWHGHRVDRRHLARFLALTGLRSEVGWPVLYPHVFGFPLLMSVLTHRACPLPLWGALQTRNHMLRHAHVDLDAPLDLETAVADQRILEKGAEVDLRTTICAHDSLVWESLTTFYYRGRHGEPGPPSPLALAPALVDTEHARWHMPRGPGLPFGRLTGDFNPVHWSRLYARAFGFRRAFYHPQFVLGQCLARLPAIDPAGPQRLDAWLKGTVFYGSDVRLRARPERDDAPFGLFVDEDERPAIVGRWRAVEAGSALA